MAPPPSPEKIDHKVKFGAVEGEVRGDNPMKKPIEVNDPLFWMRDDKRTDEKVIGRLKQENAYSADAMKPSRASKTAFTVNCCRTSRRRTRPRHTRRATGSTSHAPWRGCRTRSTAGSRGGKWWGKTPRRWCWTRTSWPRPTRPAASRPWEHEDEPVAGGARVDLRQVRRRDVRPDHQRHQQGSNADKIPKELDRIKDVDSGIVWGADDKTVYYLKMDDEHRPFQVWRHTVGEVKGVL